MKKVRIELSYRDLLIQNLIDKFIICCTFLCMYLFILKSINALILLLVWYIIMDISQKRNIVVKELVVEDNQITFYTNSILWWRQKITILRDNVIIKIEKKVKKETIRFYDTKAWRVPTYIQIQYSQKMLSRTCLSRENIDAIIHALEEYNYHIIFTELGL